MLGLQFTMAVVAYRIRSRRAEVSDTFLDEILPIMMRKPNVSIGLRQYSIPLFATQIADLAICSLEFQRAVLHIRYHLDLYNQLVLYTQSQFEKTFNNPSLDNRAALITNQEEGYRDACQRAEIIMRAIADLRKCYGPDKSATAS